MVIAPAFGWDPNQMWDLVSWPRWELKESTTAICAVGYLFSSRGGMYQNTWPLEQPPNGNIALKEENGCGEGIGNLRITVSYSCARDEL